MEEELECFKSIVYGTINFFQGKKVQKEIQNRWICYIRPFNPNDDLSKYIDKVIFTLHPTFSNRVRVIKSPPFEICEYGWGEFDIPIKIFFKGKNPP